MTNEEQIPEGITPEAWALMTPEQKEQIRSAQNQGATQTEAAPAQQESKAKQIAGEAGEMAKSAAKWAIFGAMISFFSGLIHSVFNLFSGDD